MDEPPPVAIVTSSTIMRGVVTALQWFNPLVRAFSPDNVVAAMQFLGALEGEVHVVWTEAKRLQTSLGAPASKSINLTTSLLTAMIARAQRSLLSGAGPGWRGARASLAGEAGDSRRPSCSPRAGRAAAALT